jgi:hypothetical protein
MDDMERYGDYNEIDEPPRGKSAASRIIKIAIALLCIFVVGFMAFRIFLFNYYPPEMKNIYFNDTLTAFYNEKGGDIGAKTQEIRFPYDHEDKGRFFSDYLIVVREAGQLQITLRYNKALIEDLEKEYGVELSGEDIFEFRLARDPRVNTEGEVISEPVGTLSVCESDEFLMYRYYKLVFDGVDFGSESEPEVEWLRVEVLIRGVEMEEPFMLLVYENHGDYSQFSDYKLSDGEVERLDK